MFSSGLLVLFASVFRLCVGIGANFLIPIIYSVEEYSYFKTIGLWISFSTVIQLGYSTGLYIKYGGRELVKLDSSVLKGELLVLNILLLIVIAPPLLYSIIHSNSVLFIFLLFSYPVNILAFYRLLYQAVGEYKKLTVVNLVQPIVDLTLLFVLIVVKIDVLNFYYTKILLMTIGAFLLWLIWSRNHFTEKINLSDKSSHLTIVKTGFIIMIASLSSMLFQSCDRWFILFFFSKNEFAYYSFAIAMMAIITILIDTVAGVFYSKLARIKDDEEMRTIFTLLLIVGVGAFSSAFALKLIVYSLLPKYVNAAELITVLFLAFPALVIIKVLFLNLYKIGRSKYYFLTVNGVMLGISVILNFLAVVIWRRPLVIAIATTFTYYIWLFYSAQKDFPHLFQRKDVMYLCLFFFNVYVILHYINSNNLQLVAFCAVYVISTIGFYNRNILNMCFVKERE